MTRIDVTDTLEYKTKLPVQGIDESNFHYLNRVKDLTSVMDVLKDLCNMCFINIMEYDTKKDEELDHDEIIGYGTNKILYDVYKRLLKDQERLLKKAGEWNI